MIMIIKNIKNVNSVNKWLKVGAILFAFNCSLFTSPAAAQTVIDPEEEDEEVVDTLFVPIEDEISVVDKQGITELIEFPEAMT